MTSMKRISISIPDEMDKEIYELRKKDQFVRLTYSELIRKLIFAGLNAYQRNPTNPITPFSKEAKHNGSNP